MARAEGALVVCERCGKPHRWAVLALGSTAKCVRCGAVLGRGHRLGMQTVLALTLAALVVFLIAIASNVISIRLSGGVVSTTLPAAVVMAWREGRPLVAVTAGVTALLAPALFIALRLYVLLPLAAGRVPPGFRLCVRVLRWVGRWNMIEVMTVAALLSLVRLAALAQAEPGPALYALGALTWLFAAIESAGLRHLWWHVR
jgi:paraquat-inducible protein A